LALHLHDVEASAVIAPLVMACCEGSRVVVALEGVRVRVGEELKFDGADAALRLADEGSLDILVAAVVVHTSPISWGSAALEEASAEERRALAELLGIGDRVAANGGLVFIETSGAGGARLCQELELVPQFVHRHSGWRACGGRGGVIAAGFARPGERTPEGDEVVRSFRCALLRLLQHEEGPSGVRPRAGAARVSAWSRHVESSDDVATVWLNEEVLRGGGVVLRGGQLAAYAHIDDLVIMGDRGFAGGEAVNAAVSTCARRATEVGLVTPDVKFDGEVDKVVGYAPQRRPARLCLDDVRRTRLYDALGFLLAQAAVDVKVLHTLVSIWIWGALLNRNLLAIPHATFRFIDALEAGRHPWWPSVRAEVCMMKATLIAMYADLGAPVLPVVGATDAEGANDVDNGGYGVVMGSLSPEEEVACVEAGTRPGLAITSVNGSVAALRRPERALLQSAPFPRLPRGILDRRDTEWTLVDRGRWKWADHITLGEGRASLRWLETLAVVGECHRHRVYSLEDNLCWVAPPPKDVRHPQV